MEEGNNMWVLCEHETTIEENTQRKEIEWKTYERWRTEKQVGVEDFQKRQWPSPSHTTEPTKASTKIYFYVFQLKI